MWHDGQEMCLLLPEVGATRELLILLSDLFDAFALIAREQGVAFPPATIEQEPRLRLRGGGTVAAEQLELVVEGFGWHYLGRGVQGTNGTVRHAFPWELALVLAQTCDRHCGMCGPPQIFEPLGHVGSHFTLSLAAHSVPCLAGAATSRSARTPRIAPRAETWTVSNAPAPAQDCHKTDYDYLHRPFTYHHFAKEREALRRWHEAGLISWRLSPPAPPADTPAGAVGGGGSAATPLADACAPAAPGDILSDEFLAEDDRRERERRARNRAEREARQQRGGGAGATGAGPPAKRRGKGAKAKGGGKVPKGG